MKKHTLALLLTLSLPITSYAETVFNANTCNRIFKNQGNETCLKAIKGDANSGYAMARVFGDPQNGALTNIDYAFYWHLKLSRQVIKQNLTDKPFIMTLYNTGVLYTDGLGTQQNLKKGFYWFTQAAERGEPLAMLRLAHAYEFGIGTTKNQQQSLYWLDKAVNLRHPKALIAMSKRLIEANGVERNTSLAVKHLKEAAQQNDAEANFLLGNVYLGGVLANRDLTESKKWYAQSCQLNLLAACKRYFDIDSNSPSLNEFLNKMPSSDDINTLNQ